MYTHCVKRKINITYKTLEYKHINVILVKYSGTSLLGLEYDPRLRPQTHIVRPQMGQSPPGGIPSYIYKPLKILFVGKIVVWPFGSSIFWVSNFVEKFIISFLKVTRS